MKVNENQELAGVGSESPRPALECCADWEPQTKLLSDYVMVAVLHGWGDHLKRGGTLFRFCPWCGANRAEHQAEIEQFIKLMSEIATSPSTPTLNVPERDAES